MRPCGHDWDELPHSPVFFTCADIEATYALGEWQ